MKKIITAFIISSMFLVLAAPALAKPNQSYVIKDGKESYQYSQTTLSQEKYFYSIPTGTTYTYEIKEKGLKESLQSRHLIMKVVKDAYIDQSMKIEVSKTVKLNHKGYCVPSFLVSSGAEGTAFAVDFIVLEGLIKGFILGGSLPCSAAVKF